MPSKDEENEDGSVSLTAEQWAAVKATITILVNYLDVNIRRCGFARPANGPVQ